MWRYIHIIVDVKWMQIIKRRVIKQWKKSYSTKIYYNFTEYKITKVLMKLTSSHLELCTFKENHPPPFRNNETAIN